MVDQPPASRTLALPGGRRLEVMTSGPDTPVLLFHHGTPGFPLHPGWLADALAERGWGLVSLLRPGYGASTRLPGRSVADVAADAAAALDALGVERAALAGMSGGGPHALACAALLPGRVAATLVIGAVGPFSAPGLDFLAGMGEENVVEFTRTLQGEEALRPYLEEQAQVLRTASPQEIAAQLASILPGVDQAVVTGAFGQELVAGFRHALSVSVDGWLDDDLAFVRPWGFDLGTIAGRVSLWQGEEDLMVPFAHGQWLASQIPGVRAHLEAGEGHLSIAAGNPGRLLDDLIGPAG